MTKSLAILVLLASSCAACSAVEASVPVTGEVETITTTTLDEAAVWATPPLEVVGPATTTTTAPPPPPPPTTTTTVYVPPPTTTAPPAAATSSSWPWDDLRLCEAPDWAGGWQANTGNGYYGGLQFALESWRSVGGTGYPHEHSRETQIEMGRRLQAIQGWGAWPRCSKKLGLR